MTTYKLHDDKTPPTKTTRVTLVLEVEHPTDTPLIKSESAADHLAYELFGWRAKVLKTEWSEG